MKKIIITLALLLPGTALASSGGVDVSKNLSVLFDVGQWVSVTIGFFLFGTGIYGFYVWSKSSGNQKTIGSCVRYLLIGTALISIGWVYSLLKGSFIGDNTDGVSWESGQMHIALDPAVAAAGNALASTGFGKFIPENTITSILAFIFLVGLIFFISGVYSLKDAGEGRQGEGILSKPLFRIAGGMICMNITWFGCFVGAVLGISFICAG